MKGVPDSVLHRGTVLGGKYRLVDKLGEGGMGTVWAAENIAIEAEVAVKVLHPGMHHDTATVTRFRNEARAAARIGHPSIVRVFDFGEAEDGAPYMVMERMHGESLAERLEREVALGPREAVEVMATVLDALDAAHAKDILHRDLKPENIFLCREGSAVVPKILDFGVSKFLGDDAERVRMTRTGAVIGTPAYMSPEQARGLPDIDLRADLWAIGVILFELLSGRLPFEGGNYNALLVQIATTRPPPIGTMVKGLDASLAHVVDRALSPDRAARFDSAVSMRDALTRWLSGAPLSMAPVTLAPPLRDSHDAMDHLENSETLPGATPVYLRAVATPSPWRTGLRVGAVAAVLATVTAVVIHRGRGASVSSAPAVIAASAHALRIQGLPDGARVTVNDVPATLPARMPAGGDYRVRVEAPGYQPWQALVNSPTEDTTLAYRGEPQPAVVAAPPPAITEPLGPLHPTVAVMGHTPAVVHPHTAVRPVEGHPADTHAAGHGAHTGATPTANSLLARDPEY